MTSGRRTFTRGFFGLLTGSLPWQELDSSYDDLTNDDVVIVPAFGAPTLFMNKIEERGCYVVDTTCGDVMKVWRRVRGYAKDGVTSIIHGKSNHEETLATASQRRRAWMASNMLTISSSNTSVTSKGKA